MKTPDWLIASPGFFFLSRLNLAHSAHSSAMTPPFSSRRYMAKMVPSCMG